MQIFLHDDIAAASEVSVLFTDYYRFGSGRAPGILRPVDETHKIAVVEVTEALHFVHRGNGISDTRHNLRGQFERQVHALGAYVE